MKAPSNDWKCKSDGTTRPSRLLLVDDDPALLLALSRTLESRLDACTVDTCNSGVQALELVKAHRYDTIISDVMMPGMTGWQFLSAIKQCRANTPVFLMSGHAGPAARREAMKAGATSFFAKPFDRNEFVATVQAGLQLIQLSRTSASEASLLGRAKSHEETLVGRLDQHDQEHAGRHTNTGFAKSPQLVEQSSLPRTQYRSTMLRHMAVLDKFIVDLSAIHSRTLSKLRAVQETLHRHAQHGDRSF